MKTKSQHNYLSTGDRPGPNDTPTARDISRGEVAVGDGALNKLAPKKRANKVYPTRAFKSAAPDAIRVTTVEQVPYGGDLRGSGPR